MARIPVALHSHTGSTAAVARVSTSRPCACAFSTVSLPHRSLGSIISVVSCITQRTRSRGSRGSLVGLETYRNDKIGETEGGLPTFITSGGDSSHNEKGRKSSAAGRSAVHKSKLHKKQSCAIRAARHAAWTRKAKYRERPDAAQVRRRREIAQHTTKKKDN